MQAVQPKRYVASEHDINFDLIDSDALWVIKKLRQAGHQAYIVGGSIRDLLAKITPKDFDISTSALPEDIKKIFGRRCILIGRRFRLAHVRFGHKIIEVATFRTGENDGDLIVRDNEWGTEEEDVLRRDFTINGLFYDPEDHSVIDYVGGWEDIHKRVLRSIGDPVVRFKQDPVRMIRLLKFQARFGFDIAPDDEAAIASCREELIKSSPARILEELLRMLESGSGAKFFNLMQEKKLLELLIPSLSHFLDTEDGKKIYRNLEIADEINRSESRSLDRAVLVSCLLFPVLEKEIQDQYLSQDIIPNIGEVLMLTNSMINAFVTTSFSHFPRRLSTTMGFILSTQYRLTPLGSKKHVKHKIMRNNEFGLALDLLKIRALLDKELMQHYSSWKELYRQQHHHGTTTPPTKKRSRRRRRRPRRPNAS